MKSFWTGFAPQLVAPSSRGWGELAAEAIAVQIRWFGLAVGVLIALATPAREPFPLGVLLAVGFTFTLIDTLAVRANRVFLRDYPLMVSVLEAIFIGLLCWYHAGPDSPFRFYYLLSLVCCALRHSPRTTFVTCGLGLLSYAILYVTTPRSERDPELLLLTVVILVWVTWAAGAMARLLRRVGEELKTLNAALTENQAALETRIAERTRELEESQAQVLHGEKMAAFGLLAAGIAHEVGNPLTAISGIVQVLGRRDLEPYTRDKLGLMTTELKRIQTTLRELVTFSRPASAERVRVAVAHVVQDALRLAKFYQGGANRRILARIADDVPDLAGVRDQFVQVVFNLVLNAIDATTRGGQITVTAERVANAVQLRVADDGAGVPPSVLPGLFRPYYTTKKQGTGLGLFVVRRIVETHGGRVDVASEPGQGAVFTVTLPAADPPALPPAEPVINHPGRAVSIIGPVS